MKYGNSSLRSFKSNGVYKGDYGLDIPGLIDVSEGDLLDYTAFGRDHRGRNTCDRRGALRMGTTAYFNLSKN